MSTPKSSLTPEQTALRERIRSAKNELSNALGACTHIILPRKPERIGRYLDYGLALCAICNKNFGWYCPKSPDSTCHYFPIYGTDIVLLENGTTAPIPDGAKGQPRSYDWCMFCGDPEERK